MVQKAIDAGIVDLLPSPLTLSISTLEGRMTADLDDWLIRGVKGEWYSCHPDVFELTYEVAPAEEGPTS
jgi:hypothetical protein